MDAHVVLLLFAPAVSKAAQAPTLKTLVGKDGMLATQCSCGWAARWAGGTRWDGWVIVLVCGWGGGSGAAASGSCMQQCPCQQPQNPACALHCRQQQWCHATHSRPVSGMICGTCLPCACSVLTSHPAGSSRMRCKASLCCKLSLKSCPFACCVAGCRQKMRAGQEQQLPQGATEVQHR